MHRKILTVARKLEQASKAHAGQAKVLKSIVKNAKKKQRAGVRYARKVKPGLDGRLTRIRPLTQIWLHLSIARILTMQRSPKVANERVGNGSTQTMAQAELGKDRH
jgi:hypothetical protein